ncbi:MAG: hypothetical protein LBJ12_08765 [Oscillospiraceae bacterium]|jgi:hypothetical protein|nr:hypothetical protein [Oscillospiraceae bacterium]
MNLQDTLKDIFNAVASWFTGHSAAEFNLTELVKSLFNTIINAIKG